MIAFRAGARAWEDVCPETGGVLELKGRSMAILASTDDRTLLVAASGATKRTRRRADRREKVMARRHKLCGLVAVAAGAPAVRAADSLAAKRKTYGLEVADGEISVSGVSSSRWFAVQLHIAHSTSVAGAGIIAGGPYRCAAALSWLCLGGSLLRFPHDSCGATPICSRTNALNAPSVRIGAMPCPLRSQGGNRF